MASVCHTRHNVWSNLCLKTNYIINMMQFKGNIQKYVCWSFFQLSCNLFIGLVGWMMIMPMILPQVMQLLPQACCIPMPNQWDLRWRSHLNMKSKRKTTMQEAFVVRTTDRIITESEQSFFMYNLTLFFLAPCYLWAKGTCKAAMHM